MQNMANLYSYRILAKGQFMNFWKLLSIAGGIAAIAGMQPSITHADQNPASGFYLHDGDRVVMYGDSITEQCLYTVDTETYVTTMFPHLDVAWTAAGWGGDRVTGGGGGPIDVRLDRDVLPYKPTVMTIMLAMNDGGYRPFDQGIFDTFASGYKHIIDVVDAGCPGVRYTLILPSPYDDITRLPNFPGGYNAVLIKYGQFVASLKVPGTAPADFNTSMNDMLTKAHATDPDLSQKLLPDRVHPSPAGHLVMAETLLKVWNAPALVASVKLDASAKSVTNTDNTTVSKPNFGNTITWDELDDSLPMPYDPTDNLTALVLKSSDFIQAMDQEPLTVAGLPTGSYDLTIDSVDLGKFTSDQLAAGVNLATLPTPMFVQAQKVGQLVSQREQWHSQIYHRVEASYWGSSDPAVKKALDQFVKVLLNAEQKLVNQEKAAAIPVTHHYVLTPTAAQ
jgi:lysophospholipase L1-like esterase